MIQLAEKARTREDVLNELRAIEAELRAAGMENLIDSYVEAARKEIASIEAAKFAA